MITIDKSIPNIATISASRLRVYRTCQRQYYYKYALPHNSRPDDDKNVAALLGTAWHKAIESKYIDKTINPVTVFQDVMETTLTLWENSGYKINMRDYYSTALKVGTEGLRKTDWDLFNPIALEQEFILPFPSAEYPIVNMKGYIDLIDMDGSVVDHKSKASAPAQDELDNDEQFLLYAWAYDQIYGYKPNRVIWNHLRTGRLYEANVLHDYDDKLAQLSDDVNAMMGNKYYARRQMDKVCKTECSFYQLCYGGDNQ